VLIETILNALQRVFFGLFDGINLPPLPDGIVAAFDYIGTMLGYAQNIISLVIPWSLVKIGLPIILAVELLCLAYQLVMWIIRKIPMAGMS